MPQQAASIQTCQIITVALIVGLLFFGAIAISEVMGDPAQPNPAAPGQPPATTATMLAIGMVAASLVIRAFALAQIDKGAAREIATIAEDAVERLRPNFLKNYQLRIVVGMAILEGSAFFAGIAFMGERQWVALALYGFQILNMLVAFPTEGKFQTWFENCRVKSTEYINTNASS